MAPNITSTSNSTTNLPRNKVKLRIAIIGQSQFAADVVKVLQKHNHEVVCIFTIPDKQGREDALAQYGTKLNIPVHKIQRWRYQGQPLLDVLTLYQSYQVDLNVLPYCSQFIPKEVVDYPKNSTICYHPSLLPLHRGASAINWTLMSGDTRAGFSIFWADDGLDTGDVLLQQSCVVEDDDTVDTLYRRFLYPAGVESVAEAVDIISYGLDTAPRIKQDETKATYEAMLKSPMEIDFSNTSRVVHDFIRGLDSVPGAFLVLNNQETIVYQSTICEHLNCDLLEQMVTKNEAKVVEVKGCHKSWVTEEGLMLLCIDLVIINVKRVKINGKIQLASKLFLGANESEIISFDQSELELINKLRNVWVNILCFDDVRDDSDFFQCGGASMDVVRLVESTKELLQIPLENEHVFLNSTFEDFARASLLLKRKNAGEQQPLTIPYEGFELSVNNLTIKCPTQLFIGGKFINATQSTTHKSSVDIINPHDESVLCSVQCASVQDVDKAVQAASKAFDGEWSKISARERGRKLLKLAELMETHREELATLESLDSGAVYTLALKTHVGMSIETWRYYAGWCDKIQGETIPISSARPAKNLCFTKREPVGVCGLITPWNYPLMMLSWKMAACLAAGNTCVIKPAMVCPLTALKFAELTVKAGIPPGVVNVLPGSGTVAGSALAGHPNIRKLGFTGSTEIGKVIMASCAGNLKKLSLELGGKSPLVIFADCDLTKAVRVAMQSVFFNKGENCIAAGRIFVEAEIYDEFIKRVVEETMKIIVGDPFDKTTHHGPQNHLQHLVKLQEFVQIGLQDGAVLKCGGKRVQRTGYYFEPTVFVDVQDSMRIAQLESFGPIMCVSKFKNHNLDSVLLRANRTEYGLAAGVFTKDLSKALKFSEGIKAGTVFVNTYNKTDVAAPFGGCKQSGFGKDLGMRALEEYLVTKTVTIEY